MRRRRRRRRRCRHRHRQQATYCEEQPPGGEGEKVELGQPEAGEDDVPALVLGPGGEDGEEVLPADEAHPRVHEPQVVFCARCAPWSRTRKRDIVWVSC